MRLIASAAVAAVVGALGVATFVVPYAQKRRQWDRASPEARDALLAGARGRQIGVVVLVVVALTAVVGLRALT